MPQGRADAPELNIVVSVPCFRQRGCKLKQKRLAAGGSCSVSSRVASTLNPSATQSSAVRRAWMSVNRRLSFSLTHTAVVVCLLMTVTRPFLMPDAAAASRTSGVMSTQPTPYSSAALCVSTLTSTFRNVKAATGRQARPRRLRHNDAPSCALGAVSGALCTASMAPE